MIKLLLNTIIFSLLLSAQVDKSIYIDLADQKIYAMEDGIEILEGRISSGKSGYETPTGTFTILEKKALHRSNLYPPPAGGAKMPYMMRLTWDGIAMHQGYVPRRPASHGCIRLQRRFAKKLYTWASRGTKVTIEGDTDSYTYDKSPYTQDSDGYSIIEIY